MATPNMALDLPVVGVTIDPTWATKLNTALTTVDEHDHTTGKGVQVPTAGLNINADLSLQSNDLTNIRSLSLNNNVSTLPSGDIRALYASGGNLYYNNNSGNPVQITDGSSLDTGSLALNVWELTELAGNLTILTSDSFVFINTNTSTTRTITLPAASGVTAGRYYVIKDKTGDANTNNITITPAGADTIDGVASSTTITSSYGSLTLVSDGVSGWLTNAALGGFVQIGGDLLGTGTSTTAPRVSGLTGIAGLVTMANDTALNTRNVANDTNVNLIKINGSNVILHGDTAFASTLQGSALTLSAGTTSITATANTSISLAATTTNTVSATTALSLSGGTTASLTAGSGALTLGSTSSSVGITGQTGVTATATTGAATLTATAGAAAIHGNTGVNITANSSLNATIAANINLHSTSGDLDVEADEVLIDATSNIWLTATGSLNLAGQVYVPTKAVTSSPYTVDTTTKDYVIFVDSTGGAISINLPAAVNGRYLIIQDVGGAANTNNITLVRNGSDTIQGLSANYVMDADYQGVHLCAYSGASWFIVGGN